MSLVNRGWIGVSILAWTVLLVGVPIGAQPVSFTDASGTLPPFTHSGSPQGDGFGGAAWFDCNNDGLLDLFLTNGRGNSNALFQNNGPAGFVDISASAGIQNGTVGNSGVIAADIDNDGFQDLFLTGDGGFAGDGDTPVVLFRNNGTGACTFRNITGFSGITGPITHLSAAFGDIDNDGFVDLFIGASGSFCLTGNPACVPGNHPNQLWRNNGNLTFANISVGSGVNNADGACDVFFGHYDNDPWIDLFVGNCNKLNTGPPVSPIAWPISVFRNNGPPTPFVSLFTDIAASVGMGAPGLFMGLAPADIDNDLNIDVFGTNMGNALPAFQHALWWKQGTLCPTPAPTYIDVSPIVVNPTQEFGWGVTGQDFDNNGWVDIFFAGALPIAGVIGPGPTGGNPGTLLFSRLPANPVFDDQTASLPLSLFDHNTSGVAAADYDNDGDVDIVVQTDTNSLLGGAPVLYQNQGHPTNRWLRVRVVGTTSNRDGLGARIAVGTAGQPTQIQGVYAGSSFLSMDSQWRHFGLAGGTSTTVLAVWWPSGVIEVYPNVATNQTVTLTEGTGAVVPLNCP